MPKVFTSQKQKLGELGESIAARFLKSQGFQIIGRNYTRKWGEIDIIGKKDGRLYFFEVKAVSCAIENVTRESLLAIRPEDNMHPAKLKKLYRTIETYLMDKENVLYTDNWQLDVICVYVDQITKKAKVKHMENIIG